MENMRNCNKSPYLQIAVSEPYFPAKLQKVQTARTAKVHFTRWQNIDLHFRNINVGTSSLVRTAEKSSPS